MGDAASATVWYNSARFRIKELKDNSIYIILDVKNSVKEGMIYTCNQIRKK